jgi:hypothetical protein
MKQDLAAPGLAGSSLGGATQEQQQWDCPAFRAEREKP